MLADWQFQNGQDSSLSIGHAVLDPRFLEPGRFSALPRGIELPSEIYVAPERTAEPQAIAIQAPRSRFLETLGEAMTQQWGPLHQRAAKEANRGARHVNTLTRYAYNTFAVRRILQYLDERDTRAARVLLVTAYETPLHELIEDGRVSEVVVVDLSRAGLQVVADKYAHHPQAAKIGLRIVDYSGLDPAFQEAEAAELTKSRAGNERLGSDAILRHFGRIASRQNFAGVQFESNSFDAVHLPFVMGSLYLGAMTVVIGQCQAAEVGTVRDYTDYIGKKTLLAPEAQQATLATMGFALDETRRITRSGGLIVINMWARPQPDSAEMIRLSDTPVPREAFDKLMYGFRRLFSGNPQPTLPHTVGHILASY